MAERSTQKHSAPKKLASIDKDLDAFPFLKVLADCFPSVDAFYLSNHVYHSCSQALAEREELVRSGKLTTIIFIRDFNNKGQEVSGYIDLAHRMRTEDFVPIFEQRSVFHFELSSQMNCCYQSYLFI